MLVANDGLSTGHVTRMLAIARALGRQREPAVQPVLVTTSQASLHDHDVAVIQLPAPAAARRGGIDDGDRRRLVRGTIAGAVDSFAPDLIVIDTFPSGPHGELAGLASDARRVIVRRAVPAARLDDDVMTAGLAAHALAIVADDPVAQPMSLPIPIVRVPPITLHEPAELVDRATARARLGLPAGARAIVIGSGGGGDREALERAERIARAITRVSDALCVIARGPLAADQTIDDARIRALRVPPTLLRAFDGAIAAAGYNTAHELAKAGVPTVLFAQPRPFDDQAARADRFAALGLAHVLTAFDDTAIGEALAALTPPARRLELGGADRAAATLVALARGESA